MVFMGRKWILFFSPHMVWDGLSVAQDCSIPENRVTREEDCRHHFLRRRRAWQEKAKRKEAGAESWPAWSEELSEDSRQDAVEGVVHRATGAERGSDVGTEEDAWDRPEEFLRQVDDSRRGRS